jgi:hypothetical protein
MSLDENPVTVVTVTLDSPVAIPNNVYVTLTDGKAHTYRKYWNGEPLMFVIPTNFEFTATASSFVTENGKTYFVNKDVTVSNENNVNITYTCETGIEIKNNILAYHTADTDWYVNLNVMNGTWGEVNVPEVNALEVLASDADGYTNTQEIAKYSNETIFAKAVAFNKFENGVIGYIPSYVELELFATHLPVVNNYLASKGKQPISLNNLWVSEAFNETLAWNSNGEKVEKTNTLNYYIFGKRITL